MARDLRTSRPRLKGLRAETLLRGVEGRNTRQIATLSNHHDFPTEPHDVPIILRTVFTLLDAEPFPVRPASRYSPEAQAVKQCLHCVFGWMDILAISIRKLNAISQVLVEVALGVHEQNLHILLRWMKFYLREQSWIFELAGYYRHGEDTAPRLVAEALNNLNQASSQHRLLKSMRDSEEVVDILVDIWMWQDKSGKSLYLKYPPSHTMGRAIICPIIRLFSTFCLNDSPFLVWEKMCTLSGREHSRFIRCSISRIEQWRPPPPDSDLLSRPTMPINGLETLLMALTALHFVPQSARAFVKGNVVGRTIAQAQKHGSDLPSIGRSSASFSTKLTYSLFYTKGCSDVADLKNRVICQVLEAGGLGTFLDYMSASHEANPNLRLLNDRADDGDVTELNPLAYLASFCVHRRVCDATLAAINAIPSDRVEVLETGRISEYWKPFRDTLKLYEHIWKNRVPNDRVVLCDNLKHTSSASSGHTGRAKECSHCRSVVYCSSKCQHDDWENHGEKECSLMRVYRVERELRSAWVSHRTRMFFLYLIQQFLLNLEIGLPLETIAGELSEDGSTLAYTPSDIQPLSVEDSITTSSQVSRHLVKFDTTKVPCEAHLQMIDERGKHRIAREYENCVSKQDSRIPRFNKILLESLESVMAMDKDSPDSEALESGRPRSTLGICESSLGDFTITVFGRFTVEKDGITTRVNLLNGYMRVEPGKEYTDLFGI